MQYRIVGDYPAPDFFGINPRTGVVFVSRDLRLDSLQLSSYTVQYFENTKGINVFELIYL